MSNLPAPDSCGPDGPRSPLVPGSKAELEHHLHLTRTKTGERPTVRYADGSVEFWLHGVPHRDHGPAKIDLDARLARGGMCSWYQHGKLHRDDGPAIASANGGRAWYQHGKLHRDDGPAAVNDHGVERWLRHGVEHCGDGPAVRFPDGTRRWIVEGRVIPAQATSPLDALFDSAAPSDRDVLRGVLAAWSPGDDPETLIEAVRAAAPSRPGPSA